MNRILYFIILVCIGVACDSKIKEQTTKQRPGVSDQPDSTDLVVNSAHEKEHTPRLSQN